MTESTVSLYRKFILAGGTFTIIGRLTSLFYIIIINRLVLPSIYDYVVIFSGALIIITRLSMVGMRFSVIRYSKGMNLDEQTARDLPIYFSLFFGVTIAILFWEILFSLSIIFNLNSRISSLEGEFLSRILFDVVIALGILYEAVGIRLHASLKSDQVSWFNLTYSALISFVSPLVYYLRPELNSFFISWIIVYLIPLFIWRNQIIEPLKRNFSKDKGLEILRFGLPIFFVDVFSFLADYSATFIIFLQYNPGTTTLYYWILRFNQLTLSTIIVLTSGLFPLLVKRGNRGLQEMYKFSRSYYRITSLVAVMTFGTLVLISRFLLGIILPKENIVGLTLFYIIGLGHLIKLEVSFLNPYMSAFAGRKWNVIVSVIPNILRIILPAILSPYGLNWIASVTAILFSFRLLMYFPILKEIKFEKRWDLIFPLIFSIGIYFMAIFFDIIFSWSLWMILISVPVFVVITYFISRFLGILRRSEIDLILKIAPSQISNILSKIMI